MRVALVVFALLAVAFAANIKPQAGRRAQFEQFVSKYGKTYATQSERIKVRSHIPS